MNKEREGRLGKAGAFLTKFFFIFAILYIILLSTDSSFVQVPIAEFEASILGVEREGSVLYIESHGFDITSQCTGFVSAITLAAIIFALRKPGVREKISLFVVGAVSLFLINLVRLYFVLVSGLYWGVWVAEVMHTVSWFVMAFGVIAIWYYSTLKLMGEREFGALI